MSSLLTRSLVLALAAFAFLLTGVLLIAHEAVSRRQAIRRRVDALAPAGGRPGPAERALPGRPRAAAEDREQVEIIRLFERLGVAPRYALAVFAALRLVFGLALAGLAVALARHYPRANQPVVLGGLAVVGIGAGWFLPALATGGLASRRQLSIEYALPEAVELLVVCVEAGLALDAALDRVADELRQSQPALAEELAATSADLKILPSREEALAKLAQRLDLPSVRSVVTTLSQTMRFGTPLAQALRVISAELRNDTITRMEERANRLPVLLTLPMTVFLLPCIFLIVGGPAFLKLLDQLAR